MFLSDFSIRRPVFTTMLVVAMIVLGAFAYLGLSIELMPNIEFPIVTITTIYPGAGPEEVESQITSKIEDQVSTIADIDLLESISREGVSFVVLRFELEVEVDNAINDVRTKVDAILNDLPSGVEKPQIEKFEIGSRPVISLAVSSDRDVNETFVVADRLIRDRLSQVSGVATVEIIGGQEREIQIAVDRKKLEHYQVSIGSVAATIMAENVNVPGGRIIQREREYVLRTLGEFKTPAEIGEVQIPLPSGGFVALSEIAAVRDTYEEARSLARFNGEPSVQVDVLKRSGANTIGVADGICKAVEELQRELPENFILEIATDDSIFIRDSVKDVQQNILIGIVLTAFLLYLFLRNVRGTIIVAIVMPAAIVATFLLMQGSNFTLNIISLMALGISVGILVTNAIVILENIIRHLQMGEVPGDAAKRGTDEVVLAVVASVMTNVVVFVPIAFMHGIIGRFFLQFGLTVVFATLFSLVISFTLTPMLSAVLMKRLGGPGAGKGRPAENDKLGTRAGEGPTGEAGAVNGLGAHFVDRLMGRLAGIYRGILAWSLDRARNRWILTGATTLLFFFGIVLIGLSGGEFMPAMDEGLISVNLELPAGTSMAMTEAAVNQIEAIVSEIPEKESVLSTIGGANRGVNEATILVKMVDVRKRDRHSEAIADELRPRLAGVPGATISVAGERQEGGVSADLEIEVMGRDTAELRRLANEVVGILRGYPGLVDIDMSWRQGGQELVFVPDRKELARRGISTGFVASNLRNSFEGNDQAVFRETGEEYTIRVQYADQDRRKRETLREVRLAAGSQLIPLTQLGNLEELVGEAEILRRDRTRKITVTANIVEGTVSEYVNSAQPQFDALRKPPGYKIFFAGMYEFQQESFASIFQALILAIILTYVVLAMILESFIHPVTVMITLPLGLIGAAIGLFFGGQTINIISLMAMVMLVGIVVNNAILLLDYVAQLRARGRGLREAILEACPLRLRAVVMTNLAIAIAMVPQALSVGSGAEFRITMAVVTMGGVLISAVFTLILIPSLYAAFESLVARMRGRSAV